MTHQDCLTSWLEVKGGNGKCDLCKTQFHFAPKYAHHAPDKLSTLEVISGLILRALSKWVPSLLRVLLVAWVWLGVLPLSTAYIYQGWMHRPSSVRSRMEWELLPGDLVNGGILTVTIIIGFLSLMSLGDFFRFNWRRDGNNENGNGNGNGNEADRETEDKNEDDIKVKIAPVQLGEDRDNLYYDGSERPLSEKFHSEKIIIEEMIKESNKSVMDEGQLFRKYEEGNRDEDRAWGRESYEDIPRRRDSGLEDILSDDLQLLPKHELERYLAMMENDGDEALAELRKRKDSVGEDERPPEGGMAAVKRHRSFDSCHRRILNEEADEESDSESHYADGLENHSAHGPLDEQDDEEAEDEEDEDSLFQRMMRLQEDGSEAGNDPVEPDEPVEDARFEPQFEPRDRPFDDEDPMVCSSK